MKMRQKKFSVLFLILADFWTITYRGLIFRGFKNKLTRLTEKLVVNSK